MSEKLKMPITEREYFEIIDNARAQLYGKNDINDFYMEVRGAKFKGKESILPFLSFLNGKKYELPEELLNSGYSDNTKYLIIFSTLSREKENVKNLPVSNELSEKIRMIDDYVLFKPQVYTKDKDIVMWQDKKGYALILDKHTKEIIEILSYDEVLNIIYEGSEEIEELDSDVWNKLSNLYITGPSENRGRKLSNFEYIVMIFFSPETIAYNDSWVDKYTYEETIASHIVISDIARTTFNVSLSESIGNILNQCNFLQEVE